MDGLGRRVIPAVRRVFGQACFLSESEESEARKKSDSIVTQQKELSI